MTDSHGVQRGLSWKRRGSTLGSELAVWLTSACLLLLLGTPGSAQAFVDAKPKIVSVTTEPVRITLHNKGQRPEYMTVNLFWLLNPGVPYEQEQLRPIAKIDTPPLYAFPFKVSLAKGQSKIVTIRPLASVSQEQVYRLELRPTSASQLIDKQLNGVGGGVVINIAYSILVRLLPDRQISTLALRCEGNGVRLVATGTVRYLVTGARSGAKELEPFNVYPGTPIFIDDPGLAVPGHPPCGKNTSF